MRARSMFKPNAFEVISTWTLHTSYLYKDAIEVAKPVSPSCTGDQKTQSFWLEYWDYVPLQMDNVGHVWRHGINLEIR